MTLLGFKTILLKKNVGPGKNSEGPAENSWMLDLCPAKWKQISKSLIDFHFPNLSGLRSCLPDSMTCYNEKRITVAQKKEQIPLCIEINKSKDIQLFSLSIYSQRLSHVGFWDFNFVVLGGIIMSFPVYPLIRYHQVKCMQLFKQS